MSIIELLLIAVGLAMDSFAVSICKGLSMKELNVSKAVIVGTYFGVFQALFAIIGYLLGSTFSSFIASIDHWV
ncbi:MAG: manganese efflux pump, partial [Clostridia bacterium]|nr:manganese efflux pump [Clostridia bacterium]